MKKILYVTTVSRTINAFLIPHIKHLQEQGHEVEIASNIDLEISDELKNTFFNKISFSRNPFSFKNIKAIREVRKIFEQKKYDIVHVHTPVAAFVTRFALRKKKVEVIYTAHGFHFYTGSSILGWLIYYPLEKIAARWTDKLITINNEDFEIAKTFKMRNLNSVFKINGVGIELEKYKVNYINRDEYRQKLEIDKDDFVILILAELNKNKNHIQIVKAVEKLKDKKHIKIICAGDGREKEKLEKEIKKRNLNRNIKMIGFREDVKELIYIADCVGLFSKREGLGKCLLEGMAMSKALIATNTRGPRELIEHGVNGFLVEINDVKKTKESIEIFLEEKSIPSMMGEKNQKEIMKYSLKNVLKRLENIYTIERKNI